MKNACRQQKSQAAWALAHALALTAGLISATAAPTYFLCSSPNESESEHSDASFDSVEMQFDAQLRPRRVAVQRCDMPALGFDQPLTPGQLADVHVLASSNGVCSTSHLSLGHAVPLRC